VSKRTEAYLAIRGLILSGSLPVGKRTSERELAEEYVHMSRTPVREALAVLTATGLIEQFPQSGAAVRDISQDEALRAILLRGGMETVIVAELAATRPNPESDEFAKAGDTMKRALRGDVGTVDFMLADTSFHCELARLGGFASAVTTLQGLRDRVHLYRLKDSLTPEDMRHIVMEHNRLLERLKKGDKNGATAAMRRHLQAARNRITGTGAPNELATAGSSRAGR
jgi:DNA-binding GntR family transcriptional regulator